MSNELGQLDLNGSKKNELNLLKEQTKSLVINGLNDKDGYKLVFEAKNKVVKARTSIEAEAKKLTEDARIYVNKVNESKRELLSIISDEEDRLKLELQKYDEEKERVANEEKEKAKKVFEERIKKLTEIKCIPDNLFAIGNMTDEEYNSYYQTKFNRYQLEQKEQVSINLITSSNTLDELEELHHNDLFYWSDNIRQVFEKRFNEITEDIKRKQEYFTLQLVNKINSANSLQELESLDIPNEDVFCIPYNDKRDFLIKQEEQQRQFLEQQEELNKMKAEQEEKRKQEEQERQKQLQEEEQKRKLKETRIADLKSKIWNIQTEEELKELYFKEDIQDLIPEVKHIFTERKNEILEKVKKDQQQKEFQQYLYSIGYNSENCIIKQEGQETLIYKLIGKWK